MKPSRSISILLCVLLTYSFSFSQQAQWSLPLATEKMWRTTKGGLPPSLYEHYKQLYNWKEPPKHAIDDDSVLSVVGRWAWGPCYAVDVRGNYAFIGNGPTFQVLNISNPSCPVIVAEYVTDGVIIDIRLRDTLAFVCGGKGLVIMNISNPLQPTKLGEEIIPASLRVIPTDSFAYVTNFYYFGVVDVTDPTAPRTRSVVGAGGQIPTCLAVKDRYAYVGNPEFVDLRLIDCRNPDSLVIVAHVDIGGWGISAYVRDTLLFVGVAEFDGNQSLKIFSVANPLSPIELGRVVVGFSRNYEINSITVEGQYAFGAIEGHGIVAIDIADPTQPQITDSLFSNALSYLGYSISYSQGTVYAAYHSGLWVVDATLPDSLSEQSFFIAGGYGPLGIAIDSSIAYVAVGDAGLAVLDISDPTMPVRVGAIKLPGASISVAVDSNYAYVGADSVSVINITNPYSPQRINSVSVGGTAVQIFLENNRAYILVADVGTHIFDVSNPQVPISIGFTTSGGYRLFVRNDTAYFAGGSGGLVIVDMSDPQHPVMISRVLNWVGGIIVRDSLAFAATTTGLAIVSIANPSNPRLLSEISTPGPHSYTDMALSGRFLYLSYSELIAVDISNPSFPIMVGRYTPSFGLGIAVRGQMIYLCDINAGLYVLKNDLISYAYFNDDDLVKEYSLEQNYPNPFNPTTVISYQLNVKSFVSLNVYNILGQEIAALVDAKKSPGNYVVQWNAQNNPSGTYFYKMTVYDASDKRIYKETKKMILMR